MKTRNGRSRSPKRGISVKLPQPVYSKLRAMARENLRSISSQLAKLVLEAAEKAAI